MKDLKDILEEIDVDLFLDWVAEAREEYREIRYVFDIDKKEHIKQYVNLCYVSYKNKQEEKLIDDKLF